MKPDEILEYIKIDEYSATPKYLQVISSILSGIEKNRINKGDVLPSINEMSYMLEISRDTAEKAYKNLKKIGVLGSIPGKGYFIEKIDFRQTLKVFLLFNKLSPHKKLIYDSFIEALGPDVSVDFYIYNNDFALFKQLINNKKGDYSHYVIIPHFLEGGENAHEAINLLPKEKLVLLDKKIPGITGEYAAAYENFERDIFNALTELKEDLKKYKILKMIFPDKSYFPKEIIKGFRSFCHTNAFDYKLVHDIEKEVINEGDVFINLMEDDLVTLIERIMQQKLKVGKQVGVISYNETSLKKIILNGITTISTDFRKMGTIAAELIKKDSRQHLEVPFYVTKRASL